MFRINPYRRSVTPYLVPIVLPPCDPDFQPVSVSISCQWLSYIVGALSILKEQATWDTTDPDLMLEAIQRANNLIEIFSAAIDDSACAALLVPIACDFHFDSGDGGWVIDPSFGFGTYVSGVGFESTHVSGVSEQAITILKVFPSPFGLTHVDFTYEADASGSGANDTIAIYYKDGGGYHLLASDSLVIGTHSLAWSGEVDAVDAVHIQTNSGTAAGGTTRIVEAHVNVLGTSDYECLA
jgi:hypothetical protein